MTPSKDSLTPEPTPTPWQTEATERAARGIDEGSDLLVVDSDGLPIADCSPERGHQIMEQHRANAALIVAAVNARAALLAERDALSRNLTTAIGTISAQSNEVDRLKAEREQCTEMLATCASVLLDSHPWKEHMEKTGNAARALLARLGKGE